MAEIKLTRGKVSVVDDDDLERVSAHKWHAFPIGRTWYAATNVNRRRIYLHRFIMNPPLGMSVDHLDDDGLNNKKSNLRVCTHEENLRRQKTRVGESGYRGVVRHNNSWRVRIKVHYKSIYVGCFLDKEQAAKAYDEAAKQHFGASARLNFQ